MHSSDPSRLESMYNNRTRVPGFASSFERWVADSRSARAALPCHLDQTYGEGPDETLDIFPSEQANVPVLVFIHGGYWRATDKSDHSFLAPSFVRHGICVVVLNYALCPGTPEAPVSVLFIMSQMVRALTWTSKNIAQYGGDPARITVAGHSAGGHLAATLLANDRQAMGSDLPHPVLRSALSISGLYDLRDLRHAPFLQGELGLDDDGARRASPALWPAPRQGVLYAGAGADESEAFAAQNALIRTAWGKSVVPVCELLPGLNHFSVLDALADPAHALHGRALELLLA